MSRQIRIGVTILAVVLAGLAIGALISGRMILSGTLFMFTAFAIYVREIHK